jgi:excisionase family DNA binding protein
MEPQRQIPNPADTPTVSVPEAARILGVGRAVGYAAVKSGELPAIRVGGRVLVPTAALRRLLQLDDPPDAA